MRYLILYIFFISILAGCGYSKKKYILATSGEGSTYLIVGSDIAELLNNQYGWNIRVLKGGQYNSIYNCKKLISGEVDFALAQNDISVDNIRENDSVFTDLGIRTVMPVYPEIVFIIYPDTIREPENLEDLLKGRRVGIGHPGSGSTHVLKALFTNFGIDTTEFTIVYSETDENELKNPDIDVSCFLTGPNNPRIEDMLMSQHGKLFSLDDYKLAENGSAVKGFCYNYPRAHPFVLPKNTYIKKPGKPVLTVAVEAVLLTREGVNKNDIYEMVQAIYGNVQNLANRNELLLMINEKFDPRRLNFPLHEGTINYLERNQPSFFERYAELIGVIFSIAIVLYGAGVSMQQQLKRKRKDRIDVYYNKVLEIEMSLEKGTLKDLGQAVRELNELKRHAFHQLINEKLAANESFRIFIELANETIDKISHKTNGQ
jgi:TRAP transporter TAXI family solute receptor